MGGRGRQVAVLAAIAGGVVAASRPSTPPVARRTATSAGGMEYLVLGDGPRTLLSIPGGPGSDLPSGLLGRLAERESRPYVDAGYAVWTVTRPRHMPAGHSVADMAEDHAEQRPAQGRPVLARAAVTAPGSARRPPPRRVTAAA